MDAIEKRINQKVYLYFFFSLILNAGFIFTHFHNGDAGSKMGTYEKQLAESKAVLKATKQSYEKRLATYQVRVDSLTERLGAQKTAIKESKGRTQEIKKQIQKSVKGISAAELLDRTTKLQVTETLTDAEKELVTKDSLLESQKQVYENIIAEKDSMFKDCDTAFQVLDGQLQKQIETNEALTKDLKKAEKKAKRRQFFNRALLTGGAILAGTMLLIQ